MTVCISLRTLPEHFAMDDHTFAQRVIFRVWCGAAALLRCVPVKALRCSGRHSFRVGFPDGGSRLLLGCRLGSMGMKGLL